MFDAIESSLDGKPVFPLSNKIGGRVATRMATDAIAAIILCLAGIIGYVWFRFHGVIYGVAAVVALIHDVLVALGFVALSAYLVDGAEPLANVLLIDKFQVSLTLVAAFLTIIGYSLNDTIVIFDRIREVKGKSPRLTAEMINAGGQSVLRPDVAHVVHDVDLGVRAVHRGRRRHSRLCVRAAGRLHRRRVQHDLHRQPRAAVAEPAGRSGGGRAGAKAANAAA